MPSPGDSLQEFVYAVSHDFGRPIRQIVAFTDLLADAQKDSLDDESSELFAYLKRAGEEAQCMLERLLAYSRLANHEVTLAEHDVGSVCTAALAETDPDFNAIERVEIAGSAAWHTEAELLKTAVAELLDNALRYGGDGAVRVTIDTLDDCCRISVEDQGSGIDLDHEAAALRPFGRLHPEDPGHVGLGLNICQRSLTLIRATMSFRRSSDGFAVEVRLEP